MRRFAGFLRAVVVAVAALLLVTATAGPSPAEGDVPVLPARIAKDLVVEGRWRMTGDVEVAQGATLRFAPGAVLETTGTIRVRGRVVADGTPDRPVILGPAGEADRDGVSGRDVATAPWRGIELCRDRARNPDSVLRGVKFAVALEAVVVGDGTPTIARCVFSGCGVGVASGNLWTVERAIAEELRSPRPVIEECVFVRCRTAVFAESEALPEVVRCTFVECVRGLGNVRSFGWVSRPAALPWHADRCLFLRCGAAVEGGGVVESSIFVRNLTALAVTRLHERFSTGIDRIAWRRNVLWENESVARGESDFGGDARFEDPRFVSDPATPSFAAARAPFPGVELAKDSPVRGWALDGGDPGPAGAGASGRRRRVWESSAKALRRFLVLGPPERVDVAKLPKAAPSAAGERVGDASWCAFDADERGGLDRASLNWPDDVPVVPLAAIWTRADAPAGIAEAEICADGAVAVWRGGSAIVFPLSPLRHGVRGVRVPLASTGPDGLVLWWKSSDFDPRAGVAVHLPGDGAGRDVEPPPAAALDVEPIRFGPKQAGFRVKTSVHWADVRRGAFVRVVAADGTESPVSGLVAVDAKGTYRFDLPAGVAKSGARIRIDGLRDPWGRTLGGQPRELDADAR